MEKATLASQLQRLSNELQHKTTTGQVFTFEALRARIQSLHLHGTYINIGVDRHHSASLISTVCLCRTAPLNSCLSSTPRMTVTTDWCAAQQANSRCRMSNPAEFLALLASAELRGVCPLLFQTDENGELFNRLTEMDSLVAAMRSELSIAVGAQKAMEEERDRMKARAALFCVCPHAWFSEHVEMSTHFSLTPAQLALASEKGALEEQMEEMGRLVRRSAERGGGGACSNSPLRSVSGSKEATPGPEVKCHPDRPSHVFAGRLKRQ